MLTAPPIKKPSVPRKSAVVVDMDALRAGQVRQIGSTMITEKFNEYEAIGVRVCERFPDADTAMISQSCPVTSASCPPLSSTESQSTCQRPRSFRRNVENVSPLTPKLETAYATHLM